MKKFRKILLMYDDEITSFINKQFIEAMEITEQVDAVHNGLEGLRDLHKHCSKPKVEDAV